MTQLLYELPNFEYIRPKSLNEAESYLQKYGKRARVIAGGTDLLGLMKDRVMGPEINIPEVLINIKSIPGMNQIEYNEDLRIVRIGAAATLSDIERSEVIKKKLKVLWEAVRQVGTTQLRNMGTIGGNICQRPQCMYFRHPQFLCYKKGGRMCYAITGENRDYHSILHKGKCVMAHPSDLATALTALNAKIVITNYNQEEQVPIKSFFLGPNNFSETVVKPNELLKEIQIPVQKKNTHQFFLKQRIRGSSDFALTSIAIVAQISKKVCRDIKIVLGGIAPFPYSAKTSQDVLIGNVLDERLIFQAAEASIEGAAPLRMNHYKLDLAKALVKSTLIKIFDEKRVE